MFYKRLVYPHGAFVEKILIEAVNLSPKTKDLLKERSIRTLSDFLNLGKREEIQFISSKQIKRELEDFLSYLKTWMKKEKRGISFSRNIPPPSKKKVRGEQRVVLIAILLAEPMFGNRRGIALAKNLHLPEVYREEQVVKMPHAHFTSSFVQRKKCKIA